MSLLFLPFRSESQSLFFLFVPCNCISQYHFMIARDTHTRQLCLFHSALSSILPSVLLSLLLCIRPARLLFFPLSHKRFFLQFFSLCSLCLSLLNFSNADLLLYRANCCFVCSLIDFHFVQSLLLFHSCLVFHLFFLFLSLSLFFSLLASVESRFCICTIRFQC